jgi:hypothetical protein
MKVMHMFVFEDGFYLVRKSDGIGMETLMARKIDGRLDFAFGAWQGVSLPRSFYKGCDRQMCTLEPRRGEYQLFEIDEELFLLFVFIQSIRKLFLNSSNLCSIHQIIGFSTF